MFASSIGDATICLRCQLRLARISSPTHRLPIRQQALTPTRQTRRSTTASGSVQRYPDREGPHQRILYPHGRLRGRPGRRMREQVANLGLERLGKPAEVIVLQDASLGSEQEGEGEARLDELAGESLSATDLLASINANRGLVSPDIVRRTMQEIRSSYPQKGLSWDEWLAARKKLCHGFTADQLLQYVVHETREQAISKAQKQKSSNILFQSTWTPGITPFRDFRLVDMEQKRYMITSPNLKKKAALAERILRDCWDHHVQATATGTGELEILLRPRDLSLLVHENQRSLQSFAGKYDAKVDVSRHKSIIRFTGDPVTCYHMSRDIEAVLGNIRCAGFDATPLQPLLRPKPAAYRRLDRRTIDWIASVTGTQIQETKGGHKLLIYYIGPHTKAEEDARRLLLSSFGKPNLTPSLLRQYPSSIAGTAALCHMDPARNLSWIDQRQQWSRWLCASSKSTPGISSLKESSNPDVKIAKGEGGLFRRVSKFLRERKDDTPSTTAKAETCSWHESTENLTFAVLGHVLHSRDDESPIQISDAKDVQSSEASGRTFSTTLPGNMFVLQNLNASSDLPRQAIQLRLTPSPWTSFGLDGARAFPEIEMRVEFNPFTQKPFVQKLEAVVDERVSDIMLPQERADLRLVYRSTLAFAAVETDSKLAEFMEKANLRVKGGGAPGAPSSRGRLGAPRSLQMQIPRRIIREDSKVAKELSAGNKPQDVEMEYLYAGLDYREHLDYEFGEHHVRYTIIEGGISGGRRGELLLYKTPRSEAPDNGTESDSPKHEQEVVKLFEKAYGLVKTLDPRNVRVIAQDKNSPLEPYAAPSPEAAISSEDALPSDTVRTSDPASPSKPALRSNTSPPSDTTHSFHTSASGEATS